MRTKGALSLCVCVRACACACACVCVCVANNESENQGDLDEVHLTELDLWGQCLSFNQWGFIKLDRHMSVCVDHYIFWCWCVLQQAQRFLGLTDQAKEKQPESLCFENMFKNRPDACLHVSIEADSTVVLLLVALGPPTTNNGTKTYTYMIICIYGTSSPGNLGDKHLCLTVIRFVCL